MTSSAGISTTIAIRGKDESRPAFESVKKGLSGLAPATQKITSGLTKSFTETATKLNKGLTPALKNTAQTAGSSTKSFGGMEAITEKVGEAIDRLSDVVTILITEMDKLAGVVDKGLTRALKEAATEADKTSKSAGGLKKVAIDLVTGGLAPLASTAVNLLVPGLGAVAGVLISKLSPSIAKVFPSLDKFHGLLLKAIIPAVTALSGIIVTHLQASLNVLGRAIAPIAGPILKGLQTAFIEIGKVMLRLAKNIIVSTLVVSFGTVGAAIKKAATDINTTIIPAFKAIGNLISKVVSPAMVALGKTITKTLQPAFNAMMPVLRPIGNFLNKVLINQIRALGAVAKQAALGLNSISGISDAVVKGLLKMGEVFNRLSTTISKFQAVFAGAGKVAGAVVKGDFGRIEGIFKEIRTELDKVTTEGKQSFEEWAASVNKFNDDVKGLGSSTNKATGQLSLFGNEASEAAGKLNKTDDVIEKTHLSVEQYARAQRNVTLQLGLFGDEASGASPKIKQLADRIGETGIRAKGIIGSGTGRLREYIKGVGSAAKGSAGGVTALGRAFQFLQSAIPFLSVGLIIDRFRELIVVGGRVNLELNRLNRQSGISVTTLNTFADAARRLGYDVGEVSGFMETFVERVQEAQEGSGEGAEVFHILNINIKDLQGNFKSTEEVLFDYARTVSSITDKTEAAAFNTRLLGGDGFKLGAAFKTIAKEGLQTDKNLEEMNARTQELNAAWNELVTTTINNSRALLNHFSPAITVVVKGLSDLGKAAAVVSQVFFGTTEGVQKAAEDLFGYGESVDEVSNKIVTFRHRLNITEELKRQAKAVEDAQKAQAKAVEDSIKRQLEAEEEFQERKEKARIEREKALRDHSTEVLRIINDEINARENVTTITSEAATKLTKQYTTLIVATKSREEALRDLIEAEALGKKNTTDLQQAYDKADKTLRSVIKQTESVTNRTLGKVDADEKELALMEAKNQGLAGYAKQVLGLIPNEEARNKILQDRVVLEQAALALLDARIAKNAELAGLSALQTNSILNLEVKRLQLQEELTKEENIFATQRAKNAKGTEDTLKRIANVNQQIKDLTREINVGYNLYRGQLAKTETITNSVAEATFDINGYILNNVRSQKLLTREQIIERDVNREVLKLERELKREKGDSAKVSKEQVNLIRAQVVANLDAANAVGAQKDAQRDLEKLERERLKKLKEQQEEIGKVELARFQRYIENQDNIRVVDFLNHNKRLQYEEELRIARLGAIDSVAAAQINADIDSFNRRKALTEAQTEIEAKQQENYVNGIREANEELKKQGNIYEAIGKTIKEGLQSGIEGLIKGTISWGQALSRIANSILNTIISKFAQLATNSIFNLFTGGRGGGLGSLFRVGAGAAAGKAVGGIGSAAAGIGKAAGGIGKALSGVTSALAPLALVAAPFAIGSLFKRGESSATKRRREAVTRLDESAIIAAARQQIDLRIRRPSGGSHPSSRERQERREALNADPDRKIRLALTSSLFRNLDTEGRARATEILRSNLDKFQYGGIIPRTPGGRLVVAGEGNGPEAIVPLRNGSIPVTIQGGNVGRNINITVNVDGGDGNIEDRIETALLKAIDQGGILQGAI